ncbi:uracil-DNA glycosylase [Nocardioides cavernaquae]|uniref:Uracil-DNA glycosylase n=1 Tax=Nocardioides cavernaquae TaxID=2321396 RepID=A0A3A5HEC6_9ACTN|nr:uracil-DNA glycosylase [Nocardioides cavernaquae]RJS47865.1 uracil-DNA glycosylase [Nocardioides cavernaquae]
MAADWAAALAPVEGRIADMGQFLRSELAAGRGYQPSGERVFRAFRKPLAELKVLIVGQDPYPNPQHPVGLSFSVERHVRPLPPSLANIYKELETDLGITPVDHGDLSAWADQGVMLLNRVLTVQPGASNSHRGKGWEDITSCAIDAIAARGGPRAAILWGNDARRLAPQLAAGGIGCVESAHPSPLSAYRGFFGSRPFSQVNALLAQQGGSPVDWSLGN